MKYRSFLGFLTVESQNGFNCPFERSELRTVNTHVVSDEHSVLDSEHYDSDVVEFRQRVEKWLCHFGNSFNAEYSKRGTEDTKYLSTTGAECGFTLAEVLITLSIIGVVAALTIPSLIIENQNKETILRVKKIYNILSNAYSLAVVENGSPSLWGFYNYTTGDGTYNPTGGNNAGKILKKYLNVIKDCQEGQGCWANTVYKHFNGSNNINIDTVNYGNKMVLADNTSIVISGLDPQCKAISGTSESLKNVCGFINVDINGKNGPNVWGQDGFSFWITKNGIIPCGTPDDTQNTLQKCRQSGYTCTSWIILKENLNYPPLGIGWQ